jgi:CHAD domain-containing protein
MTCEAAFRAVAHQYLHGVTEQHRAACAGSADAVHEMRIALTRLRTSIAFFAPMVDGDERSRISAELKWLHAHLGIVRDLDVALERLMKAGGRSPGMKAWKRERAACQRHLTRALRSQRYRRLVRDTSAWIEKGRWSAKRGKQALDCRLRPIGEYSAERLKKWRNRLVKKSSRLEEVGARKRHRVRLINKKLTYALDAVASLVPNEEMPAQQAALKQLRKAQKSLGQLNDDARYRVIAEALQDGMKALPALFGAKRKKRLLHKAAEAYREFARLKPFRIPKTSVRDDNIKAGIPKSSD